MSLCFLATFQNSIFNICFLGKRHILMGCDIEVGYTMTLHINMVDCWSSIVMLSVVHTVLVSSRNFKIFTSLVLVAELI